MPYLSRVYLNPLRTRCQRFLRDPQSLHAAVLGGIPEQPVDQRVLWRLEPRPRTRAELLVLTQSRPSWEHLVEQAGWPGAEQRQFDVADMEPLLMSVAMGRRFSLRVTVNPVVSVSTGAGAGAKRGKVVPVKSKEQMSWFAQRLPRWGFQPLMNSLDEPSITPLARQRVQFTKTDKNRVTLETAAFDALVEVQDAELATRSLLEGVGRARAYGCGLMTLAPPNR